ncbi:hypothetical protein LR48_Vigan01g193000 [Vigna angularis]|uniref:Protein kinase domain-containing protein n=2 Tax=Phaseolus angularis TaxID=3914 RepID=A0A0L9TQC9_PHAAN|nr:hypothetical protein LR48_Vigan01g193000 [Vigna angularis]
MATVQLCVALLFLLQLSSLQFASLGYNVPDKYFINCGSDNSVTESGKVYVGESTPQATFSSSNTERNQSSVPSPLYQTARIFRRESWYKFNIDNNGTYLVRLHFFPFSSPTNLSSASFNVSVPGFWLLQNFNGRNDTNNNSALVKEFFMEISTPSIKITFRPLESSFAFVNAIELFVLPLHLISNDVSRFTPIGGTSNFSEGLYSRVLETKHRLNVGGQTTRDILLRNWIPDDIYLTYPENAKNRTPYQAHIVPRVGDDSDSPNATSYTAPSEVYGTAKESKNISDNATDLGLFNLTWALPVDNNTDNFLRLHFCDYVSAQVGLTYFELSIYDFHVMQVNSDENVSKELPAPYYYDFVVSSDNSGYIKVSLTPNGTAAIPNTFLNGLEIMKVIESSNSVPPELDENGSGHNLLPVLLGSVLGGLVLVVVVVLLGFLWRSKMRKEKPVENSDCQLIGKGGFGNVYKGVLKNGMTVAVKRSQPGSGQGLPEFQTEIMVFSKIRHKHLVSLIGYCDERFEMILVYEYMEKGTLRDHLYNTNKPSLSWKVRLQICIDSARGLHYLHKGAAGGIIHRDVKSTNILLDENHVAKVADFGLSRSGPADTQPHVTTGVKGTFGYLDPEYLRSQQLTEKSDIYSFGVVLLEVLCARAAIDPSLPTDQINLAEWGLLCKNKGILRDIIDPSIIDQIDQNSLRKFIETIEKCLKENGSDRPSMGDVLWDLKYALQLQTGPYEDSFSSVSASLQLPNVRRLPSLSILSEA